METLQREEFSDTISETGRNLAKRSCSPHGSASVESSPKQAAVMAVVAPLTCLDPFSLQCSSRLGSTRL